jgi:type IV secretion system protein VirB10
LMPHPELTIPAGTVIPCTLQTAINSQLKGLVDCLVASDVRGTTGTVTLMPRGTTIFGEIRTGLTNGETRIFILWVRARTPDNIVVTLDSPAADEVGRAGASGYVNSHFWSRFLAAALYSVIDYGPQLANTALQNNRTGYNNTYNYTQFLTPQQSLANTILQKELNVPDVFEQNQGARAAVFVARDLDFSGVLELETVNLPGHN